MDKSLHEIGRLKEGLHPFSTEAKESCEQPPSEEARLSYCALEIVMQCRKAKVHLINTIHPNILSRILHSGTLYRSSFKWVQFQEVLLLYEVWFPIWTNVSCQAQVVMWRAIFS